MKTFLLRLSIRNFFCTFFLAIFAVASGQQTYTFTNCGATGSVGPTQGMANNSYLGTNLAGSVTIVGQGIQTWTIPQSGNYRITVAGARGGFGLNGATPTAPGNGVILRADINLTGGQTMSIVCGQLGIDSQSADTGGGGGGGTYVAVNGTPVIVAGGGGSGGDNNTGATSGTTSTSGLQGNNAGGAGGTGGTGGTGVGTSGGGGGFTSNGTTAAGGVALLNGAVGGQGVYGDGGFGGGGGGNDSSQDNGAGGGGYSGGGGGGNNAAGGGGGSFIVNTGTNVATSDGLYNGSGVQNLNVYNTSHGYVIIEELCSISLSVTGLNASGAMCAGNSITLTTNAISNYSWTTGASSSSLVVSPTTNTVYGLTATSSLNCTAGKNVQIVVSSGQPTIAVTSSTNQLCFGKTATITASGAITYTWSHGVVNGVSFTPTTTTTYTVTGQNGCGTVTAVTDITVSPLPVSLISTPTLVCANESATITATSAATSYTLDPGGIFYINPTFIVSPTVTTVFTVSATDGTCSGTETISLMVDPIPTISIVASTSMVCEGHPVTMNATGGISYTWMPGNLSGASVSVTPTGPTAYSVFGSNAFGCVSEALQVVLTEPSPNVSATTSASFICLGGSTTLTATGDAGTYLWSNGPSGQSNVVSPAVATAYTVTGTSQTNTCTTSAVVEVNVFETIFSVSGPSAVCSGKSATLSASGADSYVWVNGGAFPSYVVTPQSTNIYTVTATTSTNFINCSSTKTLLLNVHPNPTVSISSTGSVICRNTESVTLTAVGASSYSWSTQETSAAIEVFSTFPGFLTYSVTGYDANGCENSATFNLQVDLCSSISELSSGSGKFSIYPNPASGSFFAESADELDLIIYNDLGQAVRTLVLDETNGHKVTVSGLLNGVYVISARNNDQLTTTKLIIYD